MISTLTVRTILTGVVMLALGACGGTAATSGPGAARDAAGKPAGALTGDVDGDGRPDVVSLSRGDSLIVRLGSGTRVRLPHGKLPALLPGVRPGWADRSHASFGGGTWSVRGHTLVHRKGGAVHEARVPPGWLPRLFGEPVRLGRGLPALLLSQEGGDSDTWRVYVDLAGRVRQVPTRGPMPLGGGFTRSGDRAVYSWLTPAGRLFTRIGTRTPGRFHVYAWLPTGGARSPSGPPTLVAHDLGTVCIDLTLDTYGTC